MNERIAIIGSGVMGTNHARTLKSIDGVRLSHVVDVDADRAKVMAKTYGDKQTLTGNSIDILDTTTTDAVIIVSPSQYHEEQAFELISRGLHVLIEKPVAGTSKGALALGRAAKKKGVVAMAGHIELFNPTVNSLSALIARKTIRELSFKRVGSVPDESRLYHDVVNDLMIHDIAITLKLLENKKLPLKGVVKAAIGREDTSAAPDPVRASIRFGDVDAHFHASRAYSAGKVREIIVETEDNIFIADLLARNIVKISATSSNFTADGVLVDDTRNVRYFPQDSQQPLVIEQNFFLRCVRGEATPDDAGVSMEQAARTLRLTQDILEKVRS